MKEKQIKSTHFKTILIFLTIVVCWFPGRSYCGDTISFCTYPIPLMVIDRDRGLFIALTREIASRADFEMKMVICPTKRSIDKFNNKAVDVLFPAFDKYFPDQGNLIKSKTLMYLKKDYVFTRRGEPLLNSIQSLEGKRVGITLGYPYADALLQNKKIIFDEARDDETCIRKLVWKRIDAFVGEEKTALKAIENTELIDRVQYNAAMPIGELDVYYAFQNTKRGRRLAATVSKMLIEMKMDGTYDKIMSSLSAVSRPEPPITEHSKGFLHQEVQ